MLSSRIASDPTVISLSVPSGDESDEMPLTRAGDALDYVAAVDAARRLTRDVKSRQVLLTIDDGKATFALPSGQEEARWDKVRGNTVLHRGDILYHQLPGQQPAVAL